MKITYKFITKNVKENQTMQSLKLTLEAMEKLSLLHPESAFTASIAHIKKGFWVQQSHYVLILKGQEVSLEIVETYIKTYMQDQTQEHMLSEKNKDFPVSHL